MEGYSLEKGAVVGGVYQPVQGIQPGCQQHPQQGLQRGSPLLEALSLKEATALPASHLPPGLSEQVRGRGGQSYSCTPSGLPQHISPARWKTSLTPGHPGPTPLQTSPQEGPDIYLWQSPSCCPTSGPPPPLPSNPQSSVSERWWGWLPAFLEVPRTHVLPMP